nr:MAG TPA_asm: hypothetical protein [Caudoviricetes sp.]
MKFLILALSDWLGILSPLKEVASAFPVSNGATLPACFYRLFIQV